MAITNYRAGDSKKNRFRLIILFSLGLIVGLLIALITGEALFIVLALTALIPFMHLIKYKKAKLNKYLWGGGAGLLGLFMSGLLLIVSYKLSFAIMIPLMFGPSTGVIGVIILVFSIVIPASLTAAFYWFFISLAEEIYRIKYELKQ